VWFAQAEAQFTLAGIGSEKTKFCYVISQLYHRYAREVEDIITSPPERQSHSTLRNELVRRLSPLERATCPPAPYARVHGRPQATPVYQTPQKPHVRAIHAGQPEGDLDTAAHSADRITETAPKPVLARVVPLPNSAALLQRIEDLSRQLASLRAERAQPRSSSRDPRPNSRNSRPAADPPPEMTLHPNSAGTVVATEPGRKSVLSYRPPLHHGQAQ
jgi:hypothetical protein